MGIRLTERDFRILKMTQCWKYLLSRQIRVLCGFTGQRACDRRLKKLIEAGYLERKHFIYGVPYLYFITKQAVKIFNLEYYTPSIRIAQIAHDITVVDTIIYLLKNENIDSASIVTERDLKHKAGFGKANRHFPDFEFTKDERKCCVEIELSEKTRTTLAKNILNNFKEYDAQYWYIPSDKSRIIANVKSEGQKYGVKIIDLERVIEYVRNI
mgnify:CR=1 FL=1